MVHSKVGEGSRRFAKSCKLHLHPLRTNYVQCLQYLQVLKKYFKYSSTYKYLAKYLSISTSTLGKLRKYLSKVQVLSNLYISISTHVLGPMSALDMDLLTSRLAYQIPRFFSWRPDLLAEAVDAFQQAQGL